MGPGLASAEDSRPPFLLYTITGEKFGDHLSWSMDRLGDVDGDGIADLVIGAPEHGHQAGTTGRVIVASGKDGSEIRVLRSTERWIHYGEVVGGAGDIDGDGVDDILAGMPAFLEQRSGRTGELLGTVYPGGDVAKGIGDVDGDGAADFVVGESRPQDSLYGRVTAYSGATRAIIWQKVAAEKVTDFGRTLSVVDDRDGDGSQEIALPDPGIWEPPQRLGRVLVLSGRDGRVVETLEPSANEVSFGASVAELADLDGDGVRELAVGVPEHGVRELDFAGRIEVRSSRTQEILWSAAGQNGDRSRFDQYFYGEQLGALLAGVGDANGDGIIDLIGLNLRDGLGGRNWPFASLLSGKDGQQLAAYEAEKDHTGFAWGVVRLGDVNDDGREDFALGAMDYYPGTGIELEDYEWGRVYVCTYWPEGKRYIRGDADIDGDVDLTDAVVLLGHLFDGEPAPCEEALDFDRTGEVDVTDGILILVYRFMGGLTPEQPFPECGRLESLRGELSCERSFCD